MYLKLTRTKQIPDGVFGNLSVVSGEVQLVTVEDDWRDNQPRISCIPDGIYKLQRTIYYKHGYETFEVTGVPGRSRILIHPANTEEDLEGCIGVGLRMGRLLVKKDEDTGEPNVMKTAVVGSREAFNRFMASMLHVDEATLNISWAEGLPYD